MRQKSELDARVIFVFCDVCTVFHVLGPVLVKLSDTDFFFVCDFFLHFQPNKTCLLAVMFSTVHWRNVSMYANPQLSVFVPAWACPTH